LSGTNKKAKSALDYLMHASHAANRAEMNKKPEPQETPKPKTKSKSKSGTKPKTTVVKPKTTAKKTNAKPKTNKTNGKKSPDEPVKW